MDVIDSVTTAGSIKACSSIDVVIAVLYRQEVIPISTEEVVTNASHP